MSDSTQPLAPVNGGDKPVDPDTEAVADARRPRMSDAGIEPKGGERE